MKTVAAIPVQIPARAIIWVCSQFFVFNSEVSQLALDMSASMFRVEDASHMYSRKDGTELVS